MTTQCTEASLSFNETLTPSSEGVEWVHCTPSTDAASPVNQRAANSADGRQHFTLLKNGSASYQQYIVETGKAVATVQDSREQWKDLPAAEKASLLEDCCERLMKISEKYRHIAMERRGYLHDEEKNSRNVAVSTEKVMVHLLSDLHLASWMSSLKNTLDIVASTGHFPKPANIERNHDGTVRVMLPPDSTMQWLLSGMGSFELHLSNTATDVTPKHGGDVQTNSKDDDLDINTVQYKPQELFKCGGGISLVLGAGNYDAPIDVLTALFIQNNVVIYKPSPLVEPLLGVLCEIFLPLLQRKYLVFTRGDAREGSILLHNVAVTNWLMTGDCSTAYRILYGTPESPFTGTALGSVPNTTIQKKLLLHKPFIAELGNVSPYIICPGKWSSKEIWRHARHLAFALLFNGGHICAHPQVIITCKKWQQRSQFLNTLKKVVEETATVGRFYPSSEQVFEDFKQLLSKEGILEGNESLWCNGNFVFIKNVPTTSILLKRETFCPMAGEVALDTDASIEVFLPQAVTLCNYTLSGSLAATIIAKTIKPEEESVVRHAIVNLKYGSVGLNCYGLSTIYFPQLCWGGHPSCSDLAHIGSGMGWYGNCFGFKNPIKSVICSPFLGLTHYVEIIPTAYEIRRLSKTFARISNALCRKRRGILSCAGDFIKIGAGLVLGL